MIHHFDLVGFPIKGTLTEVESLEAIMKTMMERGWLP